MIDELRDVAFAAADAAAEVTLSYFRSSRLDTQNKAAGGFDPVTEADKGAEDAIRAVIHARRPQDAILGEEHGTTEGQSGLTWIIDPIDGTRGFMSGTPTWGTLISVDHGDAPMLGVIDQPYTGERFVGAAGRAELIRAGQSQSLCTRNTADLRDAVLFTTFPEIGTPDEARAFARVSREVKLTRYGMDCYAYALLAAGQIELVIEAGLFIYDVHAPIAVIEAAGGVVTDWQGNPATQGGRILAAANADLHAAALALLSPT